QLAPFGSRSQVTHTLFVRDPHALVESCARSRPLTRVSRVPALMLQVSDGDRRPSAWDGISPPAWNAEEWWTLVFDSEHGRTESATNDLRKQWRRGIAHLLYLNQPTASDLPARRKGLKA